MERAPRLLEKFRAALLDLREKSPPKSIAESKPSAYAAKKSKQPARQSRNTSTACSLRWIP